MNASKRPVGLVTATGLVLVLSASLATPEAKERPGARPPLVSLAGRVPLYFEPNQGQFATPVTHAARAPGLRLLLTPRAAVLSLTKAKPGPVAVDPGAFHEPGAEAPVAHAVDAHAAGRDTTIRLSFTGANQTPAVSHLDPLPGISHYYIGSEPDRWSTNVPHYRKVRYEAVYPGIDVVFYGNDQELEYDFVLAPGARTDVIRFSFDGAEELSLDEGGNLLVCVGDLTLTQRAPVVYQEQGGVRTSVAGRYLLGSGGDVGFQVEAYDVTRPLVIDPVLAYSTFYRGPFAGGFASVANSVAADDAGNAYVAGDEDGYAYLTKFSADGSTLVYAAYFGGYGLSSARDVVVDDQGAAYFIGSTTAHDFPTTAGAIDRVCGTGACAANPFSIYDAIVVKLDPSGSMAYSTFLGGSSADVGAAIALDAAGHVYVTGETSSSDFPTTAGAFRQLPSTGGDAFVTKIDLLDATGPVYSTYLAGTDRDDPRGIAVDAVGSAFVTGLTGRGFPTTPGAFQAVQPPSGQHCFVTKLQPDGGALAYSTYLNGSRFSFCTGIELDTAGSAYVTGRTDSDDFPTTAGAFDTVCGGTGPCRNNALNVSYADAFVTRLLPDGSGLVFSTFLGGSATETAMGVGLDGAGNVYVAGHTFSGDFPVKDPIQATPTGGSDVFITALTPNGGALMYSWAFGGSQDDVPIPWPSSRPLLDVDPAGSVYLAATTYSSDFLIVNAVHPTPDTAGRLEPNWTSAFVLKIGPTYRPPTAAAGADQTADEGEQVTLDGSASTSSEPGPLTYLWSQLAGPTVILDLTDPVHSAFQAPFVSANQTLTFQLVVDDGVSRSAPDTVDVTVVDVNHPPVADAGDDSTIKEGAIATLDGSNSFDPEGDAMTFDWQQVVGPVVTLVPGNTTVSPTFTASVGAGSTLVFKLRVSDGKESSVLSVGADSSFADTVAIAVVVNSPPAADAGVAQTKDEGALVTLDGTASSDPDGGDVLSFQWTQVAGTPVALSSATASMPSFEAPLVGPGGEDLVFQLVVRDNDLVNPLSSSVPDEVIVHVRNLNDAPRCDLAFPSTGLLWPPNHKMIPVSIEGVVDTDSTYSQVTIRITGVTQDEPVNGLGDGDSSPDAVIQAGSPADSVLLRAERAGNRNGRVYVVGFSAHDGFEGCAGSVAVAVPHSRTSTAVDDGQVFNSTEP
jgi:hypothetical protein